MISETKKVFALAVILAAGCVGLASEAQAGMTRSEAYSAARVDTAFDLVAEMPAVTPVSIPLAQKGDLLVPPGCADETGDSQAECMDVAYEVESAPSVVVEQTEGTTTTLTRLDAMTVAGVADQTFKSE